MIIIREETDYTEAIEAYKNDAFVILEPWGRSIDHLRLTIIGKKGTPYTDGKFIFEIKFPDNYPFAPPYAYAVTLMWLSRPRSVLSGPFRGSCGFTREVLQGLPWRIKMAPGSYIRPTGPASRSRRGAKEIHKKQRS